MALGQTIGRSAGRCRPSDGAAPLLDPIPERAYAVGGRTRFRNLRTDTLPSIYLGLTGLWGLASSVLF